MDEEVNPVKMPFLRGLWLEAYFTVIGAWFWLHHAAIVHVFRLAFCRHCSGYFHRVAAIRIHDVLGDDTYCGACYARAFGESEIDHHAV